MNIMRTLLLLVISSCFTSQLQAQSAAPLKLVDFILTPNHADWNYEVNESATVKLTVLKFGVPIKDAVVDYELGPEMLPAEKKTTITLKDGTATIDVGTTSQPGFRRLAVNTMVDGKRYSGEIKLAYSPNNIQPTVNLPDDFNSFWETAKQEARKIPMDPVITYLPDRSTSAVDVYLVNLQNDKLAKRLYGFLCKPKAPGKYPVLFEPPGAGIKPINPAMGYAEQGFITLSIEIHGISPLLDADQYTNISNAFGDYYLHNLDDRNNYYYKSVYLGCVRAIDFLCSLPEWDGKNVVATGGSQGGGLSIITAALDKRVNLVSAFYPALSDMTGYLYGRAGGWPHMFGPKTKGINDTKEKRITVSYYDVVNFARQLTIPGFYSWGYNDNTVPPTTVFAVVNSIKAPKTVVITPISGHWRFAETNQQSMQWVQKNLRK